MRKLWLAASLAAGVGASASAQRAPRAPDAERPLARERIAGQQPNPHRQALQRQVREAFAKVVRKQLNLNDDQMKSLQRVDANFERQRRSLLREERQARLDLTSAMADSSSPDQSRIARQLDVLLQSQRKRADLLESEQKELSGFLTPLQRAKYFAMKERLNRRLQQLAQSDSAGRRGGPPAP
jgi:hypothetical protein